MVGLIGVVIGLIAGSGFTFWSTRRSELERAVIACCVLGDELRALRSADPSSIESVRLETAWAEQRSALIVEMRPDDFEALAAAIRRTFSSQRDAGWLEQALRELTQLFWHEHQALIVVPFINYVRGNVLTARVHDLLVEKLPEGRPDAPTTRSEAAVGG